MSLSKIVGRIAIKVTPDLDGFRERVKSEAERAAAQDVEVTIVPRADADKSRTEGREAAREFEKGATSASDAHLQVEGDRDTAIREGRQDARAYIRAAQESANLNPIRPRVDVPNIRRQLDSVANEAIRVRVDVDRELVKGLNTQDAPVRVSAERADFRLAMARLRRDVSETLSGAFGDADGVRLEIDRDAFARLQRQVTAQKFMLPITFDRGKFDRMARDANKMWSTRVIRDGDLTHGNLFKTGGVVGDLNKINQRLARSAASMRELDRTARQARTSVSRLAMSSGDISTALNKAGLNSKRVTMISVRPVKDKRWTSDIKAINKDLNEAMQSIGPRRGTVAEIEDARNAWREVAQAAANARREQMRTIGSMPRSTGRITIDTGNLRQVRLEASRVQRATEDIGRSFRRAGDNVRRETTSWRNHVRQVTASVNEMDRTSRSRLRRFGGSIEAATGSMTNFGDSAGRAFGRGSRNNFLHLLGGMVAGAINIVPKVVGAFGQITSAVGTAVDTFKTAREMGSGIFSSMAQGMGAFASSAKGGVAALLGLAAAAAAIGIILPPLLAGVVVLLGVITSLVSGLTFALAGMLLPLIPMLGAVVAGFGLMGAALASLGKDARKKLLEPLKSAFSELGRSVKSELTTMVSTVASGTARAVSAVTPMTKQILNEFTGMLRAVGEKMRDPRQVLHLQMWETYIPAIFRQVVEAVATLGMALMNFFTPVLPYALDLATAFGDMADRFLEWTKTASGMKSIEDFMRRAWDAAKNLGNAIVNTVVAAGNLFSIGENEGGGGGFLKWLNDATNRMREFTGSVDGQEKIKSFFRDVKSTGKELMDVIGELVDAFRRMNTESNRADFQNIVSGIGDLIRFISDVISWLDRMVSAVGGVGNAFAILALFMQPVTGAFLLIKAGIEWVVSALDRLFSSLGKAASAFEPFQWLGKKLGMGGEMRSAFDSLSKIANQSGTQAAQSFSSGFDAGDATSSARQLPGLTTQALSGLPGLMSIGGTGAASSFGSGFQSGIPAATAPAVQLPGLTTQALAGLPGLMSVNGVGAASSFGSGFQSGLPAATAPAVQLPGLTKASVGDMTSLLQPYGLQATGSFANGWNQGQAGVLMQTGMLPGMVQNTMPDMSMLLASHGMQAVGGFGTGATNQIPFAMLPFNQLSVQAQTAVGPTAGTLAPQGADLMRGFASGAAANKGAPAAVVMPLPAEMRSALGNTSGTLTPQGQQMLGGFGNGMVQGKGPVATIASAVPSGVSSAVGNTAAILHGQGLAIMTGFKVGMIGGLASALAVPRATGPMVVGATTASGSSLVSAGRNVMSGFAAGMNSMRGYVIGTAARIANAAASAVRAAMVIRSPSRVMRALGVYSGAGFALGMKDEKSHVEGTATSMANVVAKAAVLNLEASGRNAGKSLAKGISSSTGKVQSAMSGLNGALAASGGTVALQVSGTAYTGSGAIGAAHAAVAPPVQAASAGSTSFPDHMTVDLANGTAWFEKKLKGSDRAVSKAVSSGARKRRTR